mgnify:CR=1 FL=1
MRRWRYGPGVHKVDFLLGAPVPWADPRVGQAATVHVGGTAEEIVRAERDVANGVMPERPFVMAAQQYAADPSRGLVDGTVDSASLETLVALRRRFLPAPQLDDVTARFDELVREEVLAS